MDFPDRKMGSDIVWIERRAGKCPDAIGRLANRQRQRSKYWRFGLAGFKFLSRSFAQYVTTPAVP